MCEIVDDIIIFSGHQFCHQFLPLLLGGAEIPSRTEDLAEISDDCPRSYLFKPNNMKTSNRFSYKNFRVDVKGSYRRSHSFKPSFPINHQWTPFSGILSSN